MKILKAKLFLDLVDIKINVVAEYPDLVEENNDLLKEMEKQGDELDAYNKLV
jgi:hypothetical protein